MAYPATPKTWVAGDVLTAAQLNAELRDALLGAFPLGPPDTAWTGYTPTLTQSATVTKTVSYGKYQRVGRLIVAQASLSVTGAGTASNRVLIGLPVAAAFGGLMAVGSGTIFDTSAGIFYSGTALPETTTSVKISLGNGTVTEYLGVGGFTAALASGDVVTISVTYEAAT